MPTIRETRTIVSLSRTKEKESRRWGFACLGFAGVCVIALVVLGRVDLDGFDPWKPVKPLEFIAGFLFILSTWAVEAATFLFQEVKDSRMARRHAEYQAGTFLGTPTIYRKEYGPSWNYVIGLVTLGSIVMFIRYVVLLF